MQPRSWLFVPADSERKIAKALDSEADAIIFDLEDSVAPAMKPVARDLLRNMLKRSGGPQWWVRVNPLGSEFIKDDLELMGIGDIHGMVLPKAEGGADVDAARAPHGKHPRPRDRHRDRGEPVRPPLLPRSQIPTGGDELGRGGPVRRARRIFEI